MTLTESVFVLEGVGSQRPFLAVRYESGFQAMRVRRGRVEGETRGNMLCGCVKSHVRFSHGEEEQRGASATDPDWFWFCELPRQGEERRPARLSPAPLGWWPPLGPGPALSVLYHPCS